MPLWIAGAWWVVFAAMSFYWAAGGTVGLATLGSGVEEQAAAREPWFVGLVWLTGVLKLVPVALLAALVSPREILPRRLVLAGVWLIGLGLLAYGGLHMVLHGLVLSGAYVPGAVDRPALVWRVLFWNPWWLLGGALYCGAAWRFRRRTRGASRSDAPR
ncbi:DUF3995 domain-containing protein [Natrononativus amylolyticus]|uniref:DUF3995 domain-containing protein n=1 Tax=Natrononativus amylolyticus TaxID=2963434 RepID=UPI0020CCB59C|nr:DUF3995 domain-containing protein [Natrononativus amylolyticus]